MIKTISASESDQQTTTGYYKNRSTLAELLDKYEKETNYSNIADL